MVWQYIGQYFTKFKTEVRLNRVNAYIGRKHLLDRYVKEHRKNKSSVDIKLCKFKCKMLYVIECLKIYFSSIVNQFS